jgi:SAM-dependent methyltransferase
MLDVYLSMMRCRAVISAAELGIFEVLGEDAASATEIARRVRASPTGLSRLLPLLRDAGWLHEDAGAYRNAPFVMEMFTGGGAANFNTGLRWSGIASRIMDQTSNAVLLGRPPRGLWDMMKDEPSIGADFAAYMETNARYLAHEVQDIVTLPPGARRMLDVGGSHGVHTVEFLRRYPALTGVILDLPESLQNTPGALAAAGVPDRAQIRPEDVRTADIGEEEWDVVLYFYVAHNQSPYDNESLFERVHRALRPGGVLIVIDYFKDPSVSFHAAFDVTLLTETGTGLHTEDDYREWLRPFADVERRDLRPIEKGSLLIATKAPDH